jgi:hypothetical protein
VCRALDLILSLAPARLRASSRKLLSKHLCSSSRKLQEAYLNGLQGRTNSIPCCPSLLSEEDLGVGRHPRSKPLLFLFVYSRVDRGEVEEGGFGVETQQDCGSYWREVYSDAIQPLSFNPTSTSTGNFPSTPTSPPLSLFALWGSRKRLSSKRLSSSPRSLFALWGSRKRLTSKKLSSSPRRLFALWEVEV